MQNAQYNEFIMKECVLKYSCSQWGLQTSKIFKMLMTVRESLFLVSKTADRISNLEASQKNSSEVVFCDYMGSLTAWILNTLAMNIRLFQEGLSCNFFAKIHSTWTQILKCTERSSYWGHILNHKKFIGGKLKVNPWLHWIDVILFIFITERIIFSKA